MYDAEGPGLGSTNESDKIGQSDDVASVTDSYKKESASDEDDHQISFSSYQLFVIITSYLGYSIMMYNRKSFFFALPYIIMDHYFSTYQIGMILGAQMFTYIVSRFMFSLGSDFYSPKYMLSGGLFLSGVVILSLSDQDDWINMVLLSGANGAVQGMGWPSVSKMVRAWYPPVQFGFWYALLSTAASTVTGLGPTLSLTFSVAYGWRKALQLPALVAIAASVVVPFAAIDKPSDVGYEDQLTLAGTSHGHWSDLAASEFMALIITCFCTLQVILSSCIDWGATYLVKERGMSVYLSSSYLMAIEIGGIVGSVFLGAFTDLLTRRRYSYGTGVSPRMIAVEFCVAGSCLCLNLFLFSIDEGTPKSYITILGFWMGFCMYGAISLLGTISLEVAPIQITGAALAAVGAAANIGTVIAGSPMNYIAEIWGWYAVFVSLNIMCTLLFLLVVAGKGIKANYGKSTGGPAKIRM